MNYLAPAIGDESFGTAHARHAVLREGTLGLLTVQLLLDYVSRLVRNVPVLNSLEMSPC